MNFPVNSLPYIKGLKTPARDFAGTVLAAGQSTEFQKDDEVFGISMAFDGTGFLAEVAHTDAGKAEAPFMDAAPSENKSVVLGGSSEVVHYT
ncbi:hypothetical protein A1O3_08833 [Capronia epimyces CBS 606.96]|uniref:Uncharacterized protein n=1 Tax=Capronia epimyces CBS 606.96 TaxID=1182542 RepID=W9XQU7_9EURO|nr:uncharacterized protein A1O3_08833 [Capronia epimyces CBS 606.96]EXJ79331.1 hypothetical protein A1O3_08833 [Capronia epimyces CBS 606.96]